MQLPLQTLTGLFKIWLKIPKVMMYTIIAATSFENKIYYANNKKNIEAHKHHNITV